MKRIDVHNHVIPETLVKAMQANPVYNTRIEGEGHNRVFIRGKTRFPFAPEFYDADAKLESMDRVEMTPGLTQKERENIFCNAATALFNGKI